MARDATRVAQPLPVYVQRPYRLTPIVAPVTSSVGTSVTQLLRQNPTREAWLAVNTSQRDVYLGFNREVSVGDGILLAAGGGFVKMTYGEDDQLVYHEVHGIANGGSASIYIVEFVRVFPEGM